MSLIVLQTLDAPHYRFRLLTPVECIQRDTSWIVRFSHNHATAPMIYAFGDPDEPIAAVLAAFVEAVCAGWCSTLELLRQQDRVEGEAPEGVVYPGDDEALRGGIFGVDSGRAPRGGILADAQGTMLDWPAYPGPRESDDGTEIWTGDEVRTSIALLGAIERAERAEYNAWEERRESGHLFRHYGLSSKFSRETIDSFAERLRERYKTSIFW